MKNTWNGFLGLLVAAGFVAGCTGSREVAVTGEVSAPATTSIDGEITLDFLDVRGDDEAVSVHTATLDAPGAFEEKVELEGDSVRVRALNDANGNGKCDDGEASAQVDAKISDDDTVEALELELKNAACPTDVEG
jgi:hypothetical protein